jgi:ABC-type bacteriocin/lantibiotic exporter with double-glycine peptidase domain
MPREPRLAAVAARFPAVRRLHAVTRRRRRVPVVQQMTPTECGAACLAMVLGHHGRDSRLDDVRAVMRIGRDGANAVAILDAAAYFRLRGRGLRIALDKLSQLPSGSLLHWNFNHFVVFERMHRGVVELVDPALGRRRVSLEEVGGAFTGVALVFEPGEGFETRGAQREPLTRRLRALVASSGDWRRILVVSLLVQLFGMATPLATGAIVDRVVPYGDRNLLTVVGVAAGAVLTANVLATLIRGHLLLELRTVLDSRMTLGFLDHLLQLPFSFFHQRPTGDLMMRLNSNAVIREILTTGTLSTLLDGTMMASYLVAIFCIDKAFGLVVATLAGAQLLVLWLTMARQRELMADTLQTQSRSESYLVEMIGGIETLKASGGETRAGQHWSGLFVDQLNVALARGRLNARVDALVGGLRTASPIVILVFGAMQALAGAATLGAVLALCALAGAFLAPLGNVVTTLSQLQLLGSYLERIDDVLAAEPERRGEGGIVHQARGRVTLEHVSFRYAAGAAPVLSDVSVDVLPRQLVAIVGRSGSGKTTLANLLLGLYAPTTGRVLYDGVDLAEIDLRSLRRQLGIVTQSAYLFSTSVRANIALNVPDLPFADIVTAARRAHIHDDISAMPLSYDSLLVGGGAALSGGQRQRVALARALAHEPAVLLLDEATSALDALTERAVQEQLDALSCTRIVIAHRLSTIRRADQILVLDNGRIVERGRHGELLAAGGTYAQLIASQLESGDVG